MQHPLHGLAGQTTFFSRNIAHNLDFLPDDKLTWKPAPSANSALEVVQHLLGAHAMISAVLTGANPKEAPVAQPQTRDEAKAALIASADAFAAIALAIDPSTLGDKINMGFGEMPKAFIAGMVAADTIHHHGQICYIQTLLGDTESHFDMSLLGG